MYNLHHTFLQKGIHILFSVYSVYCPTKFHIWSLKRGVSVWYINKLKTKLQIQCLNNNNVRGMVHLKKIQICCLLK